MRKSFIAAGILLSAVAVVLGAFGAHGLKKLLDEEAIEVFKTGVQYQFCHAFALILTGLLSEKFAGKEIKQAGNFFITGVTLFSGSLYIITVLKAMNATVPKFIGPVTPLGGLFFIAGWLLLLLAVIKKK